jgi:hypothetical protein
MNRCIFPFISSLEYILKTNAKPVICVRETKVIKLRNKPYEIGISIFVPSGP